MDKQLLSKKIGKLCESSGIDAVGFAEASEFSGYLLTRHRRRDPKLTLPNAKSIIVAGIYIGGGNHAGVERRVVWPHQPVVSFRFFP